MKNRLFFFLSLLAINFSFAQDNLVWKVSSTKIADSTYQISARATVPNGSRLYVNNPTQTDGVEGVKFVFQLDNIKKLDSISYNKKEEKIKDVLLETELNVLTGEVEAKQTIKFSKFIPAKSKFNILNVIANDSNLIPFNETQLYEVAFEGGAEIKESLILPHVNIDKPLSACGEKVKPTGWLNTFILGFIGGLIALLTPCMFPMIPVTVSFFTKRSPTRKKGIYNGLLYGFFILLIYTLFSVPFHLLDNISSNIFNVIATHPIVNLVFFIVFIIFAISFFGYFEITLPHQFAGKADSKSGLGSVFGIFFMALTLVIVSFSCTGIILGTLLVGTAQSGAWALTIGMGGFGLALGLPFALFAIFPNWLESLPKSGGWLDVVKKVLAFVEVALAFKFLSNADLVEHWDILKREIFIAIWIIISICLALYAFGFIRLPHDYKGQKISMGRKIIGFVALAFSLYLAPGLTKTKYANLKLISGIAPPLNYSIYSDENRYKGLEPNVVNDLDKAIELAKKENKPLLIDFTGWNCANCRQMEDEVWTETNVSKILKDSFVLVSLYVDDGKKLAPQKQLLNYKTQEGVVKDILTIGDKYAVVQSDNFKQTSQPLYVILNNNGELLSHPIGKTNADKYLEWLKCGLNTFRK